VAALSALPADGEDAGMSERWDVVVVGGGPSGAAAAYWLSEAGHDVLVVEDDDSLAALLDERATADGVGIHHSHLSNRRLARG
jgi:glycine/D-amino acid oxidase-like deaminating enzyme